MTESGLIYLDKDTRPMKMRIIGGLLLLWGLSRLMQNPIFGSLLTMLSGGMLFYTTGTEFDFKDKKFRKVIMFGPQKFGNWTTLPEISYVSVFKLNETSGIAGRSGTTLTSTDQVYVTNLIHSKNKRIRVYKTLEMKDAFDTAQIFADALSLKIWDATEGKGNWKV